METRVFTSPLSLNFSLLNLCSPRLEAGAAVPLQRRHILIKTSLLPARRALSRGHTHTHTQTHTSTIFLTHTHTLTTHTSQSPMIMKHLGAVLGVVFSLMRLTSVTLRCTRTHALTLRDSYYKHGINNQVCVCVCVVKQQKYANKEGRKPNSDTC